MLGIESGAKCPKCNRKAKESNDFESFDIECGNSNPSTGEWVFDFYCDGCGHEFKERYSILARKY